MNKRSVKNITQLLWMFLQRDLKERYVGSVMGFYWSIINPIVLLGLYWFVFSRILKINFGGTNAALYIFTGMLPFLTFQESVQRSMTSISVHSGILKNIVFPSELLPVYISLSALINQLVGLAVLITVIALFQGIGLSALFIPVLLVFQLLFTAGLSMILTALNVFFPDASHLVGIMLVILIFITPVFYPSAMIPADFHLLLYLNPLAHLVDSYRDIILSGVFPATGSLVFLLLVSVLFFSCGIAIYNSKKKYFGDVL